MTSLVRTTSRCPFYTRGNGYDGDTSGGFWRIRLLRKWVLLWCPGPLVVSRTQLGRSSLWSPINVSAIWMGSLTYRASLLT